MRKSLGDPAGKEHFSPRAGSPPASYEPDQRDNTAGAMHYRLSAWQTHSPHRQGQRPWGRWWWCVWGGGLPSASPAATAAQRRLGAAGKGKRAGGPVRVPAPGGCRGGSASTAARAPAAAIQPRAVPAAAAAAVRAACVNAASVTRTGALRSPAPSRRPLLSPRLFFFFLFFFSQ